MLNGMAGTRKIVQGFDDLLAAMGRRARIVAPIHFLRPTYI
jgi:hypothetical protein